MGASFRIVCRKVIDPTRSPGPMRLTWGLYEVHYDEQGEPVARSAEAVVLETEAGPEVLTSRLAAALSDAIRLGVLDDDEAFGGSRGDAA